jgi:aminoglycoside phosphotransferase (APT) family kinase protein
MMTDARREGGVAGEPEWSRIEAEHPGLRVRSTRFLGEGWCSRVFVVNDELVVRCPKRAGHWDEIEREMAFLAYAADRLPLPVPRYVHAAPRSPASPHGYAAYRYLVGRAMNTAVMTEAERSAAAERLAEFLRAFHTLEPDAEIAAILPRDDGRRTVEELVSRAEREIVPRLEAADARALARELERHMSDSRTFSFTARIIHADFSKDHILVHEGAVAAVIDFGDVAWGDPDYDFMYLSIDAEVPFVDEVASRYGHPDRDLLRAKLRFFTAIELIDTLLNGEDLALDGQIEDAWQRLRARIRRERD